MRSENIFGRVVEVDSQPFIFDLSRENNELNDVDLSNPIDFQNYLDDQYNEYGFTWGLGRYNENRIIYDHSGLFDGSRTVHLGVDFWVRSGTNVIAPFQGIVHSFKNNDNRGDYGPTIILEHNVDGKRFFTLYGHLSEDSLNLRVGQRINQGEIFARVGSPPSNGNWPPHLHFQVIYDIEGREGDYPGVCSIEERERYLENCPDPIEFLRRFQ